MPGWKIAVWVGGLVVAVLALRALFRLVRIRRFRIVLPGRLFRGGQPGLLALWALARVFRVRTIINLREDHLATPRLFGMREHHILLPPRTNLPTYEQLQEFLALLDDPANLPVLVHCKVGANRTGIMMAAWRILRQGWTYDQALTEMAAISGKPVPVPARDCLRELTERSAQEKNPTA